MGTTMKRLVIALAAMLAFALPAPAQHGETRAYFRDFLAACRADGYCSATAYVNANPPTGIVADHILRIGRHRDGPDWEISFSGVAVMPRPDTDFAVIVDESQRFDFAFPDETMSYGAINDFFLYGHSATGLLEALRAGSRADVYFRDEDDELWPVHFSLSGLVASMTWIDEQQNREGSEIRAGALPVGLEPAYGGVGLHHVPDAVWRARAATDECDALDEIGHRGDVRITPIGGEAILYIIPCRGGAYNLGYTLAIWDGHSSAPLPFARFDEGLGWQGTFVLFNIAFDEQTGRLTAFEKGRGLGDCGSQGTWHLQGRTFRMLEYTHKQDCDGQGTPGVFPVIYTARET